MREHVNRFIRQCPCCQKMSYLNVPIHTIPFTIVVYESMERLEVDTIGPLPADEDGHRFKLNVIDCFTRWVSLHPTKDTTAQSCVAELLQHIRTFGTPSQIVTDNGTVRERTGDRTPERHWSTAPNHHGILQRGEPHYGARERRSTEIPT